MYTPFSFKRIVLYLYTLVIDGIDIRVCRDTDLEDIYHMTRGGNKRATICLVGAGKGAGSSGDNAAHPIHYIAPEGNVDIYGDIVAKGSIPICYNRPYCRIYRVNSIPRSGAGTEPDASQQSIHDVANALSSFIKKESERRFTTCFITLYTDNEFTSSLRPILLHAGWLPGVTVLQKHILPPGQPDDPETASQDRSQVDGRVIRPARRQDLGRVSSLFQDTGEFHRTLDPNYYFGNTVIGHSLAWLPIPPAGRVDSWGTYLARRLTLTWAMVRHHILLTAWHSPSVLLDQVDALIAGDEEQVDDGKACGPGDDSVAGFIWGQRKVRPDGTPYAEVEELYVAPEYRGSIDVAIPHDTGSMQEIRPRYGKQLLAAFEHAVRANYPEVKTIILEASSYNHSAIGFYQHMGYDIVHEEMCISIPS